MIIIGIDPGKTGGICLFKDEELLEAFAIPTITQKNGKDMIDFKAVGLYLQKNNPDKVYLEKVGAGKFGGRVSMFNFGVSFGGLMSCILVLNYDLNLVIPQRWKKIVLGENYNHEDKNGTIDFCKNKFPNMNLLATKRSKVPHDGICDSIRNRVLWGFNRKRNNKWIIQF
jgi:hypothetical protein